MRGEELAQKWYYAKSGQRYGPLPAARLRKMVQQGDLSPDDLVWCRGMEDWQPVSRTPLVQQLAESRPAPATPPAVPEEPPARPEWGRTRTGRVLDKSRSWLEVTARVFDLFATLGSLLILGTGLVTGLWLYRNSRFAVLFVAAGAVGAAVVFFVFKAASAALKVQAYMEARQRTMMMRVNELHEEVSQRRRPSGRRRAED